MSLPKFTVSKNFPLKSYIIISVLLFWVDVMILTSSAEPIQTKKVVVTPTTPTIEVTPIKVVITDGVVEPIKVTTSIALMDIFKPRFNKTLFIDGVKHWEGFRSKRYVCKGGVATIGYGFTGKEMKGRWTISKKVAAKELKNTVLPKYEAIVDRIVKVKLNSHQKASLTSFVFNLGESNLKLLVSGEDRLNGGNYESVYRLMPLYIKAGKSDKKVRRGLVLRRAWEVECFKGNLHTKYGN